jgi:hypothetical protein
MAARTSGENPSRRPMKRTWTWFSRMRWSSAILSASRTKRPMRASTSSGERRKFSVEKTQTVTVSDPHLQAPLQDLVGLLHPELVPLGGGKAQSPGVAAVSVQDEAQVPGHGASFDLLEEAPLVEPVEGAGEAKEAAEHTLSTLIPG